MDELHAAIAAYLRGQRRTAEVRRPVRESERPLTDAERARQLFGYAEGRFPAPRCQVCGRLNQSADETHIPHAGDHVDLSWVSV